MVFEYFNFRLFEMGLEKGEDPRKIYARAIELFNMKNYQDSSYLFKNCIQVSQVKYLPDYIPMYESL